MKKKFERTILVVLALFIALSTVSAVNIHRMVERKDYRRLRNLMFDDRVNPNTTNKEGETPLQLAINLGYDDIVDFLLSIDADSEVKGTNGETALFYAIRKGSLPIIKALLKYEAKINTSNNDGNTPLILAIENNNLEVVKIFIEKGADIYFKNKNNKSAAESAIEKGVESLKTIATPQNIELLTEEEIDLLALATKAEEVSSVKWLLEKGADPKISKLDGISLTEYAFANCEKIAYAKIALLFLERGISIPSEEFTYINTYINSPKTTGFYSQGGFPLHKASQLGHMGFVKYFMEQEFDPDKKDDQALSCLNTAIRGKQYEIAKYLIEQKVDLNSRTPYGDSPLTLLLRGDGEKQPELVKFLVNAGSEINLQNNWGSSPLLLAIQTGYPIEIINLLFDPKTSTIIRNNDGITALHAAVKSGEKEIIKKLLDLEANINATDNAGDTPFFLAIEQGFEFLSWFVDNINIYAKDDQGNSVLHLVIQQNCDVDLVKLLLVKGIPINQKNLVGNTPFLLAVQNGDVEISRLLLDAGGDLFAENKNSENPMSIAVTQPWENENSWLLNDKFLHAKDYAGDTPIHWAVNANSLDVARGILGLGIDINQMNNYGQTALHKAILNKNAQMIALLFESGADPNVRDYAGNTIYHYIVYNDSAELIELFDEKAIDVNIANIYGRTALHEAISRNAIEATKIFIENSANIHLKDNWGRTPVHYAAVAGNLKILQYLLDSKAPHNIRDNDGETPLHQALKNNQQTITNYLVCMGADIYATNKDGETPMALVLANPKLTQWFINNLIVNTPNNDGNYPLHLAIEQNASPDVVLFLVDKKIQLNDKNMAGETPLYSAMKLKNYDAAKILITKGADIFAMNKDSKTPFFLAAKEGEDVLNWFINSENITTADNQGNTKLHHAAIQQDNVLYQYLIKRGADSKNQNIDGYTPEALLNM